MHMRGGVMTKSAAKGEATPRDGGRCYTPTPRSRSAARARLTCPSCRCLYHRTVQLVELIYTLTASPACSSVALVNDRVNQYSLLK